jgi:hypothetical protein
MGHVLEGIPQVVLFTRFTSVKVNVVVHAAAVTTCCADEDVAIFCVV